MRTLREAFFTIAICLEVLVVIAVGEGDTDVPAASGVMTKTRKFDSDSDSSFGTSSLGTRVCEIVYWEVTCNGRIVDVDLLWTP